MNKLVEGTIVCAKDRMEMYEGGERNKEENWEQEEKKENLQVIVLVFSSISREI